MANIGIDFSTYRSNRYELADGGKTIRQFGPARDLIRPLDLRPHLYSDFALLDGSPESFLGFARLWGLLMFDFEYVDRGRQKADILDEEVAIWRNCQAELHGQVEHLTASKQPRSRKRRANRMLTLVGVNIAPGAVAGDPPSLVLNPLTLHHAMLLQLGKLAVAGIAIRECQQCGRPIEVGGPTAGDQVAGEHQVTRRKRVDAQFCSVSCRNRFHYERRR